MSFVCIQFKTVFKGDKAVDYVLLAPVGEGHERSQTWYNVNALRPNPDKPGPRPEAMAARWAVIEPAYNAWKKGEDVPEGGTALAAWSGVTVEQAAFLRTMGITSVEQVAEMSDSTIQKLPWPNKRDMPGLAKTFIDRSGEAALAAENARLKERLDAMEEVLRESMETKKRGPGRPKKDEAA